MIILKTLLVKYDVNLTQLLSRLPSKNFLCQNYQSFFLAMLAALTKNRLTSPTVTNVPPTMDTKLLKNERKLSRYSV